MASQRNTLPIARTASWTGGIALLLIAVLAGIGYAGLITPLITPGGAVATARAIAGAESQFRVGILLLTLSAVLDVVVAAVLLVIFEPGNRMLATTAAWFRVAYSAVFVVAIAQLGTVPTMLGDSPRVMSAVDSYRVIWQVGLILFAAHLLLVGYLALKAGLMRGLLGVLLVIAGSVTSPTGSAPCSSRASLPPSRHTPSSVKWCSSAGFSGRPFADRSNDCGHPTHQESVSISYRTWPEEQAG